MATVEGETAQALETNLNAFMKEKAPETWYMQDVEWKDGQFVLSLYKPDATFLDSVFQVVEKPATASAILAMLRKATQVNIPSLPKFIAKMFPGNARFQELSAKGANTWSFLFPVFENLKVDPLKNRFELLRIQKLLSFFGKQEESPWLTYAQEKLAALLKGVDVADALADSIMWFESFKKEEAPRFALVESSDESSEEESSDEEPEPGEDEAEPDDEKTEPAVHSGLEDEAEPQPDDETKPAAGREEPGEVVNASVYEIIGSRDHIKELVDAVNIKIDETHGDIKVKEQQEANAAQEAETAQARIDFAEIEKKKTMLPPKQMQR